MGHLDSKALIAVVSKAVASLLIPAGHLHESPQVDSHQGEGSLWGGVGGEGRFPICHHAGCFLDNFIF